MNFFFEVLIGGLLSGVMYALVALGFVLIYKASGVFNFAQGAMVFFAAPRSALIISRKAPMVCPLMARAFPVARQGIAPCQAGGAGRH